MRIILLTLLALLLVLVSTAGATPFLVCDPYPSTVVQPTYFLLVFDGGTPIQSPVEAVTGGVRLHYDVGALTKTNHTSTVAACNTGGCSTVVPFSFTLAVPASPVGIKLE